MRLLTVLVVSLACACSSSTDATLSDVLDPAHLALPTAGSGGFGFAFGSCFAGAAAPNGLAKVGPDTSGPYGTITFLHYSGYWYGDTSVQGFSHLHLHGTGATDYGVLSLMPMWPSGPVTGNGGVGALPLDKATEKAEPGSYALTLNAPQGNIAVAIAATPHAAHHKYTFDASANGGMVVLDLAHHLNDGRIDDAAVTLDPDGQHLRGRLHSIGGMSGGFGGYDVWFEVRARRAWTASQVWSQGNPPHTASTSSGTNVGASLTFAGTEPVELQLGLSMVSAAGAKKNLDAELPEWDFDKTKAATRAAWNALLSRVAIAGGTDSEQQTFYSQLYHAFLMPSIQSDVDGSYRGEDGQVHTADSYRYLSDFSLWDTYRTLHPLYDLAFPTEARDSVRSLLQKAREGGSFPRWPLATGETGVMIGASSEIVVADAYLRGVTDFDVNDAYQRLRAAALDATPPAGGRGGRDHEESYDALGYVPQDAMDRSVSWTTEFAHDDFALMNLATALGDTASAARLEARRHGWQKLWDPASGFLRARNTNGALAATGTIDATVWLNEFAEADAWQSLFAPAHDPEGLVTILGGKDAALAKLTSFFTQAKTDFDSQTSSTASALPRPYFWAGNEPDLHTPFLFAQLGRPDLTQQWSRWAADSFFSEKPDGVPGNDDGGAMGAFYVFTALGLYPLPGSDVWIVGTPRFPRAHLAIGTGTFTIDAPAASAQNVYIQSATLNGKPLTAPTFKHAEVKAGGTLHLEMGPKPSTWGQAQ
ncbi:MAG: GH92 family glycosyl hydrolase [Deltaproteobacteria bacterium]|nr:GH92 family glycosyl hydrolase [Deltaproteobacteria bacterium]